MGVRRETVSGQTPVSNLCTAPDAASAAQVPVVYPQRSCLPYGGDDVDKTTGALIQASVSLSDTPGVRIRGGQGVGRVTKPGLDQPVGEAAINRVPRQMIREAVEAACRTADYDGGAEVTISVPEGEAIAQKTFNPQMGIVGGISILGTSGIVEPMSMQAMIDTMALELRHGCS